MTRDDINREVPVQPWPDPPLARETLSLVEWRSVRKNSLRGYATVVLRFSDGRLLEVIDCSLHSSHGRCWASLPARPLADRNGTPLRDEKGRQRYQPFAKWSDRAATDRFSEAVVAAVIRQHGADVLDGDAP